MNSLPSRLPMLACMGVIGVLAAWLPPSTAQSQAGLPRFTEEREAAVRFFVGKHLPELLPVLDELKKHNGPRYQREISLLFQATEYLAELRDDPRRHELELKIWQTENRAYLVLARMAGASMAERKALELQLQDLARELVELDLQVLKLKAEQLTRELQEIQAAIAQSQKQAERQARERFERLLEKIKRSGQ